MLKHTLSRLRCEYLTNPLGLGETSPRFSWEMIDTRTGARQSAYRVRVATSEALLRSGTPDLWDTGKIDSTEQNQIAYVGQPLKSRTAAVWEVTTWDATGQSCEPARARFEIGLLEPGDWSAKWISTPMVGTGWSGPPVPVMRKQFRIDKPVKSARLYSTAAGVYDAHINAQRISDDYFRPGWTDYLKRIQYQCYDVTSQLRVGENVIATLLGDGWYAGRLAHLERSMQYGDRPALFQQLEITHTDGSMTTVVTDDSWHWCQSGIISSDMLQGEEFDARLELPGWGEPGFDQPVQAVVRVDAPSPLIVAQPNESVRVVKEIAPVAEPKPVSGAWNQAATMFDMGQNFAGIVRLKVKGPRGATIKLRYGEMLQANGSLYVENLRGARATDMYTLRGDPAGEVWQPRFTFHGFRYVEVSAHGRWRRDDVSPKLEAFTRETVTGLVLMSDTAPTGSFECSDPLLNQLQSNIQWGQRSNFLEAPTDCPQRDERLGWTGDAQIFAPTAAFNMDVAAFFTKWAIDGDDAQFDDGRFPAVVPHLAGVVDNDAGPGWSEARIICPWTIYRAYGDRRILERHYTQMKKWIDWQASTVNPAGLRCADKCGHFAGFSDWLSLDSTWQSTTSATPRDFIGTAYFAYASGMMSDIANVLGRSSDADTFAGYRQRAITAFNNEYVTNNGRLSVQTQTAYLMALSWDLLPETLRPVAFERLMALFQERDWHLSTGFLGTPLICPVLTRFGRADLAYKVLMQKDYPGWLFPVTNGATTMWERWNSWTPDKGFGDAGMNSFNHYAYGAVGMWMYETIAGLRADRVITAHAHLELRPLPGGNLTHASATLHTLRGPATSSWKIEAGRFKYRCVVPPNASATLVMPDHATHQLVAGEHTFECANISG